jgi:CRP-like cAMP-binding protein
MSSQLKKFFQSFSMFEPNELEKISSSFKPKQVKKNTLLLNQGTTCKEFYYVQSGGLRTFFIDKNGHEKTRYVMLDNHIGTTLTSFISQKPSFEFIEVLEDTYLWSISYDEFFKLNEEMDNWKKFYQKILELAYSFQNRKIEALVTLTAQQRYEQLLHNQPEFIQRLSNKILASYLDMREETLSRLKSK